MKEKLKKLVLFLMVFSLMMSMSAAPTEIHAAGKVTLDQTKVTVVMGDTVFLRLKNAPRGATVTWSSNKKAVATVDECGPYYHYTDDNESVEYVGEVHTKKVGTAKITAKVGKKSYSCTVTVKKFALSNTKGKNTKDVKALKAIIREQNLQGARLPTDLNAETSYYKVYDWDDKGNLISINWYDCNLKGNLSFKDLTSLTHIDCNSNQLSSLDVRMNTALTALYCSSNQLSNLDVSKNTALTTLHCSNNQLNSLDLSKNTALKELYCFTNRLSSLDVSKHTALAELQCSENFLTNLDVSKNTALKYLCCHSNPLDNLDVSKNTALIDLDCRYNRLSSLDLSKNTALMYLDCSFNQLGSLDLSKNTALKELWCDDNVKVKR